MANLDASQTSSTQTTMARAKLARAELRRRLREAAASELVPPTSWEHLGLLLRIDAPQSGAPAPAFMRKLTIGHTFIREETPLAPADDLLQLVTHWADMATPPPELPMLPRLSTFRRADNAHHLGSIPAPPVLKPSTEKPASDDSEKDTGVAKTSIEEKKPTTAETKDNARVLPLSSAPRRFIEPRFRELRNEILANLKAEGTVCLGMIDVDDDESTPQLYAGLATALCDAHDNAAGVLLVDASLVDRRLSRSFASANLPGLGEHVLESTALSELIVPTSLHGVSLLPCGAKRPRELRDVEETTWERLFTQLRQQFNYIIVEFSSESTLAGTLAAHLDALHLCMRLNRTPRTRVNQLVRRLEHEGIRNLGCLLADLPRAA